MSGTITKPVPLIVSNAMFDAVEALKTLEQLSKMTAKILNEKPLKVPDIAEEVARKLLCRISHDAHLSLVFKALEAVNAPSTREAINDHLQAVKDVQ